MNTLKNYWLVAGQVVTTDKKGLERRKSLNALMTTERNGVTRMDLAKAQQAIQHRFVNHCEQVRGAQIVDVFIISVSILGEMSQEEFHAGFEAEKAAEEAQMKLDLH